MYTYLSRPRQLVASVVRSTMRTSFLNLPGCVPERRLQSSAECQVLGVPRRTPERQPERHEPARMPPGARGPAAASRLPTPTQPRTTVRIPRWLFFKTTHPTSRISEWPRKAHPQLTGSLNCWEPCTRLSGFLHGFPVKPRRRLRETPNGLGDFALAPALALAVGRTGYPNPNLFRMIRSSFF